MSAEKSVAAEDRERDPLEGLPPDLARVLRDPTIFVPQDAAVFRLVALWMDAPSDTASAWGADEWRGAWVVLSRRYHALREAVEHVVNDSPGTPDSVKDYLRRAL